MRSEFSKRAIRTTGRQFKKNWILYLFLCFATIVLFMVIFKALAFSAGWVSGDLKPFDEIVYTQIIAEEKAVLTFEEFELHNIKGLPYLIYELPRSKDIGYVCEDGSRGFFSVDGQIKHGEFMGREASILYEEVELC